MYFMDDPLVLSYWLSCRICRHRVTNRIYVYSSPFSYFELQVLGQFTFNYFLDILSPFFSFINLMLIKDKSPEVPFHRITLTYSYFEEFEFFRQFSKKQNRIKKKYQLNRIEKFVDKAKQCFAFLHIKQKFKFAVQWSWFLET